MSEASSGRSWRWIGVPAGRLVLRAGVGCSSACSRDAVDRRRHLRRGETPWRMEQRTRWTTWTLRPSVDGGRFTHNPEVAGSNPAPATSFRRSRPFPGGERAFCVSGTVVKRVAATALRAARQRDGGDGVTRDETAWTWWTLPPAISGCLAQRYSRRTGVRAGPTPVHAHARIRVPSDAITHRRHDQCPRAGPTQIRRSFWLAAGLREDAPGTGQMDHYECTAGS